MNNDKLISFEKVWNYILLSLNKIDNYKVPIYIFYFIIYFILYYFSTIPKIFTPLVSNKKNMYRKLIISFDVIYIFSIIIILLYYFKYKQYEKFKIIIILIPILLANILIAFNAYLFNEYLVKISESKITTIIYLLISSIFYIIFIGLFIYNINIDINIEFFLTLLLIILFFIEYCITYSYGINTMNNKLKNDDFSTITVNCFKTENQEKFTNNKIDANYLKTIGNIPIAFLNNNTNQYQDLVLADFYYPGSYYSYLADSPLNGTPNLEALQIVLVDYKCRIIHLDIYWEGSNDYDPNSIPVVRCENMSPNAKSLSLDETFSLINKYAWFNNNLCYPLFLYLNFNFNIDNSNICIKIYKSLLKYFSKHFVDKKYSFAGRNSTFSISMAKIKECLGKIIIITNVYPTKTVLDELINVSTNNLNNHFNFLEYKQNYIKFPSTGISQDNDKNTLLNNAKSSINVYYSKPNENYKNNNQAKAGLFNPSFQDCAQYGIQSTLMYIFVPDDNLKKWNDFFKNKNNFDPVLKDELLRSVDNKKIIIEKQNPTIGLQKPQKYCLIPGMMTTEKSNISNNAVNNTC